MKNGHKAFLNDEPEETGYISWNVTDESDWCTKKTDLTANLTVADCRRSARFDFNVYGNITIDDRINKAT